MQEILAQVFSYVWGVWRHRWLALAVAWGVAVVGWIWVWQLPESYVARARVYVDTNTVLRPLLAGLAVQPDVEERIALLSRTLLSRPNLEKLMRMTDLDLEVTSDLEEEELLNKLSSSINLSAGQADKSLYSISVKDPDRDTARRIAQALITVFIESSLSGKREESSGAQDFLERQIKDYEARLIAAETRVANFKQKHSAVLGGRGGYYQNLNDMRTRLRQAEFSLQEEKNRVKDLQKQLAGEAPLYVPSDVPQAASAAPRGGSKNPAIKTSAPGKPTPLDSKIYSVQEELNELSVKYTDRHPQVRQLTAMLDDLLVEKEEELRVEQERMLALRESARRAAAADAPVPEELPPLTDLSGLVDSPVYLNIRKMLAESKSKVAGLNVRVEQYKEQLEELEDKVTTIPDIEGQLKQLERDYSVISTQHSALMSRRETIRMGQDVEQKANDVTFRVIDPPFVPSRPSEPDKLMLNGMVLAAGLAVGIGVALLVSLVYPVFFDQMVLGSVTGVPVLGSVTLQLPKEERRREKWAHVAFSALVACLPVACLLTIAGGGALPWS